MNVRAATEGDADAAVMVLRDSITQLCIADHKNDASTLSRWLRNKNVEQFHVWRTDRDRVLLVADDEVDGIVGVGLLSRTGELHLCYLKPGWQRRGIGSEIVRSLEEQAQIWGLEEIRLLSSSAAQSFWQRHGYVQCGKPTAGYGVLWDTPYRKAI